MVDRTDAHQARPAAWFPPLADAECSAWPAAAGSKARSWPPPVRQVTVFDNSPQQLAQDRYVARREGLAMATVEGDMRDLSAFADATL